MGIAILPEPNDIEIASIDESELDALLTAITLLEKYGILEVNDVDHLTEMLSKALTGIHPRPLNGR